MTTTSEITLHDFQLQACREIYRELILKDHKSCLLVAPTGAGKTIQGSYIIKKLDDLLQWDAMFFAERREIIHQSASKLSMMGLWPGIIMAGDTYTPSRRVQVASLQSYLSWVKRGKIGNTYPRIVVVDEAHGSLSPSYSSLLDDMLASGTKLLGMTATPIGRNGRGLADRYEVMIKNPGMATLIERGFLVQPQYYVGLLPDLSGVRIVGDDYSEADVNAVMDQEKLVGDVVDNWLRISKGRPTICFGAGVPHSMHLAQLFKSHGIRAQHIDGDTDRGVRDDANIDLAEGRLDILCNYGTHVEGTDIPPVSCIIDAGPTKSLSRYLQRGGRMLRTFTGKVDANYHDHAANRQRFGPLELERDWQLCHGRENMEMNDRAMGKQVIERVCPECGFLFKGAKCLNCGEEYVRNPEEMEFVPAKLERLTYDELAEHRANKAKRKAAAAELTTKQAFYAEAMGWCESLGKKPGFAFHAYQDKFKELPPRQFRDLPAAEPTGPTISYMQSRLIKAAKGFAKARQQEYGRRG